MATEALSNGDKILSENYFQHADHFTRILSAQEINKKSRYSDNNSSLDLEKKEEKKIDVDSNEDLNKSKIID